MEKISSHDSGKDVERHVSVSPQDVEPTPFVRCLSRDRHPFALIDWFLPHSFDHESAEGLLRARLTVVTGFVIGSTVLAAFFTGREPTSEPMRIATLALAVILVLAPALLKCGVSVKLVQNGLVASICSHATLLAVASGGSDTGAMFLALAVPLLGVLLCGARVGVVWSLTTCAALIAVAFAVEAGYEPPVQSDPASTALWNLRTGAVGILAMLGMALTHAWLRESDLEALTDAHESAEHAHRARLEIEAQFRNQLEELVEERTRELSESRVQLRRADRLASLGTLAAGIAHEINNPVGSILLGAQYALSCDEGPEREKIVREVLESNVEDARRCGRIVENLLRFSRNKPTERSDLDLNAVTRRALATLREPASAFELQLSQEPLPIRASEIEIEQMIINLVRNALQSGPPVSSKIRIRTERRQDEALIHIVDEGKGIETANRERIFDPLFTTRIAEGGTGLGLSLVHGIVEGHQGGIEVESKIGVGTRFSVSLPLDTERAGLSETV